jgi:ABC-2 type transport system permease protein
MKNSIIINKMRDWTELAGFAFTDELKTVFKEKWVLLIFLVAVFAYPVIYSVAYMNKVVRDIPVTIVDLDHTASSRQLIRMMDATKELSASTAAGSLKEARQLFWNGDSRGVIMVPEGFEKSLLRGDQASLSVYCDAGFFLLYKETLTGVIQSSGTFSAGVEVRRLEAAGNSESQALSKRDPMPSRFYMLYNPSGAYTFAIMPGLILVTLQQTLLIGIGMMGGAGKEKRNNLKVRPDLAVRNGTFSVVFGKGLAYFVIYLFNAILTLIYISAFFGFPAKGNIIEVALLIVPFLFATIFLGLAVSMLFRRREHAIMVLVFISPIVLFLSGLSWPSVSIPHVLYSIGHIFPTTSMISAYQRIRTMGVSMFSVKAEFLFLTSQMIIYYIVASVMYHFTVLKQKKDNC